MPLVAQILEARARERRAATVDRNLCEHFAYTRQELFQIVKLGRIESFDALLASHGSGDGCEICRPAVASILASTWNDFVLEHATIQDTNDRFLANIQRGGTYSVIPRIPGGEITPEKLIVLGEVAKRFDLYCKITGGQRIDLLGARVEQLPDIWEALVDAGFESGHAYGKAMRTVKSCVGTTWCRYGVQDSTALAIRIEERYRGIRAPHKLKSAVSGCIRECAEAQSKDFGVIATEKGWNLYVCGNGGSQPRHADLLAARRRRGDARSGSSTASSCTTSRPRIRSSAPRAGSSGSTAASSTCSSVVVDDALGICAQLERDMQQLVDTLRVRVGGGRARSRSADARSATSRTATRPTTTLAFVARARPEAARATGRTPAPPRAARRRRRRGALGAASRAPPTCPRDGGVTVRYGDAQLAVFHFASRGAWYATQATCPHRERHGARRAACSATQGGEPKVACPHAQEDVLARDRRRASPIRSTASATFPVEVRDGERAGVRAAAGARRWRRRPPGVRRVRRGRRAAACSDARGRRRATPRARDALLAAASRSAVGSGGFAHLDPALFGYLGATRRRGRRDGLARERLLAAAGVGVLRARARRGAPRVRASLRATLAHAGRDLAAQRLHRAGARACAGSRTSLLSLGTLASFAITRAARVRLDALRRRGRARYRVVRLHAADACASRSTARSRWLVFHGLEPRRRRGRRWARSYFLALRLRARAAAGTRRRLRTSHRSLLLLVVALTGLALPASRGHPRRLRDRRAARTRSAVIVLLVAMPVLEARARAHPSAAARRARGARAGRAARSRCAAAARRSRPAAQQRGGRRALLAARGFRFAAHARSLSRAAAAGQLAATQARARRRALPAAGLAARPAGAARSARRRPDMATLPAPIDELDRRATARISTASRPAASPRAPRPTARVKTHCCFCGQQCGVQLLVKDERVVGVEPWEEFPFNRGKLCPKGVKRYLQNNHPDRLLQPLVRTGRGFAPHPVGRGARPRRRAHSSASRRATGATASRCSRARRSPTRRRT